jgi:hypothetical protein
MMDYDSDIHYIKLFRFCHLWVNIIEKMLVQFEISVFFFFFFKTIKFMHVLLFFILLMNMTAINFVLLCC